MILQLGLDAWSPLFDTAHLSTINTSTVMESLMRTIPFVSFLATTVLASAMGFSDDMADQAPLVGTTHGVNLSAIRDLSYRVDWVNQQTAKDLKLATVTKNDLLAIDQYDQLVCYDLDSGRWRWSTPVGNHIYRLLGISVNETTKQVFVNADGAVFAFESATGNLPAQSANPLKGSTDKAVQKLNWSANTPAVLEDTILLYGSRNGELVWHNCSIGFTSQTYAIANTMQAAPTVHDGIVVATGGNGSVAAINLKTARALWMIKLLDAVVSSPAIAYSTVYIAGTDQYLRAIDLYTGRPRWKYLTTSELTDSPVIIEDALYQRIPDKGLACFSAFAPDITGELRWTSETVNGNVITTTPSKRILCWDTENRILQEVDPNLGNVTSTMHLPMVRTLIVDAPLHGNIYFITDDDAIVKIIPRLLLTRN